MADIQETTTTEVQNKDEKERLEFLDFLERPKVQGSIARQFGPPYRTFLRKGAMAFRQKRPLFKWRNQVFPTERIFDKMKIITFTFERERLFYENYVEETFGPNVKNIFPIHNGGEIRRGSEVIFKYASLDELFEKVGFVAITEEE